MSETEFRATRRLPLALAGAAAVAVAAGGLWMWLGQRVPVEPGLMLANARVAVVGTQGVAAEQHVAGSALVVRAPTPSNDRADLVAVPPPLPPHAQPVTVVPPPEAVAMVPPQAAMPTPAVPDTSPAAPVAGPVSNGQLPPSFDIVRVSPRGEAVLAGRAAPGATVTITDNGRKIAEAVGDSEGQWVALPSAALPVGGQQLALSSATPAGRAVAGEAPLLVVVPAAIPPAVTRDAPPSSTPVTSVAILTPANAAPRVLQGLPAAPSEHSGKLRLGLDVVDYDEHGAIRFGGTAVPGSTVRAYVDNHAAGEAAVDAEGHWSLSPPEQVATGEHRLRVDQLGAGHKVAARVELPFERTPLAGLDLGEGRIIVQPRETLWRIARHAYGQGVRYTVIFQANRDQIRDPNMIFPGQIFDVPQPPASPPPPPG